VLTVESIFRRVHTVVIMEITDQVKAFANGVFTDLFFPRPRTEIPAR
jgi:uncharacterized protein YozE (UPF0346 family)